jgi:hypothetical protein
MNPAKNIYRFPSDASRVQPSYFEGVAQMLATATRQNAGTRIVDAFAIFEAARPQTRRELNIARAYGEDPLTIRVSAPVVWIHGSTTRETIVRTANRLAAQAQRAGGRIVGFL